MRFDIAVFIMLPVAFILMLAASSPQMHNYWIDNSIDVEMQEFYREDES